MYTAMLNEDTKGKNLKIELMFSIWVHILSETQTLQEHPPRWLCWQPGSRRCSSSEAAAGRSSSRYRSCCPPQWRAVANGCQRRGTEQWSSTGSLGAWRSGSEWELGSSAGFLPCLVLCVDVPLPPPPGTHCKHRTQTEWTDSNRPNRHRQNTAGNAGVFLFCLLVSHTAKKKKKKNPLYEWHRNACWKLQISEYTKSLDMILYLDAE